MEPTEHVPAPGGNCLEDELYEVCGEIMNSAIGHHTPRPEGPTCTEDQTCENCNEIINAATGHYSNGSGGGCTELCDECGEEMDPNNHNRGNLMKKMAFGIKNAKIAMQSEKYKPL